jgi:hypothetical protein
MRSCPVFIFASLIALTRFLWASAKVLSARLRLRDEPIVAGRLSFQRFVAQNMWFY